uniref:Uncharacterized protein n=1 Tax=Anguilla anguilla TaxID=7936 RepID=A0A0E9QZW9_ANGAN
MHVHTPCWPSLLKSRSQVPGYSLYCTNLCPINLSTTVVSGHI